MSKIISEKSNFIIIGAWNPAIIQPEWLKKEFPSLIPDKFGIQAVSGIVSSFRFEFEKIFLDPTGGRLVFIPKKLDEETLNYIANLSNGIQNRLSHTPIAAAGANFVFSLDENEAFTLDQIETDEQIKNLYLSLKECDFISKSIGHVFSAEDHAITINYDFHGNTKVLQLNYEYKFPLTDAMKRAADSLVQNFKHAENLCKELIRSK